VSTPPAFAPNPLNFGVVAPSSQTPLTVSSAPLAAPVAVIASIKSSSLLAGPFIIKSVGPPAPVNPGTVTGPHGVSTGGTGAAGISQPVQHIPGMAGGGVAGGGGVTPGLQQVGGSGVAGQDLDVEVEFAAPASGSATSFAATLQISSADWDSPVTVPLQAQVGTLSIACPPISVTQARTAHVAVTVTNDGPATAVTLSLDKNLWPSGLTVSLDPTGFNLAAGKTQSVTLKVSADITAKPSVSDQSIYWAAFGNLTSFVNTKLTVVKLTLRPSPIPAKYKSLEAKLGKPLGHEAFCTDDVGQYQAYEHGAIYWSGAGDTAFEIDGAVLTRYLHSTNPEVGAPPGFPSTTPTLGDYATAPAAGFGYPITDTITSKSGAKESRFQHDYGIYATSLGTFVVSPETFYRSNGGSTGSLGLPIADSVGSTAGGIASFGTPPTWFSYQDFENGGIFTAAGKSEVILFSKPPGSGTKFTLPTPDGPSLTGTVYTQPTSSPIAVPLWALVNIAPDEMTKLVKKSVQDAIKAFNKTAPNQVNMVSDATLQNPPVTGYAAIGTMTPIREYQYGFVIHAAACANLLTDNVNIVFELYLSLSGVTVHAGPGQTVTATPVNPSVTWVQEGAGNLPQSARDTGTKDIVAAVTKNTLGVPVPSSKSVPFGTGITAEVDLYFVSIKVLTDGTLSLLAAVSGESVTLG
jgi:hypothetical protein